MPYDRFTVPGTFQGINHSDAPDVIGNGEAQDILNCYQLNRGWLNGRFGSDSYGILNAVFDYAPTDARLVTEYDTDKGTPEVGKPGITSDGHKYHVVMLNTVSGVDTGGAIVVLDHDTFAVIQGRTVQHPGGPDINIVFEAGDATTGLPNAVLSIDGVTYVERLLAEDVLYPKAAQANGKLFIPLVNNRLIALWIENGIWHCEQIAIRQMDVDVVLVDARKDTNQENNGKVSASLVLSPLVAKHNTAKKQAVQFVDGVGTYDNPVVNRADTLGGTEFVDIMQQPTRDPDKPLVTIEGITVQYEARNSPTVVDVGYQTATDIFYRPPNQVRGFDKNNKAPKDQIPESRWGYEFVWVFKDGRTSNPSADLWIGDMLWSVLDSGNAADLHSSFNLPVYGESPEGLISMAIAADIAVDDTTCIVTNSDSDRIPPPQADFYAVFSGAGVTNVGWLVSVGAHDSGGAGFALITFKRGQPNDAFTVAAASTISFYFDAGSVITPSASFDNAAGTFDVLKSLKAQLYASDHAHFSDDVWITSKIDRKAVDGQSFEITIGQGWINHSTYGASGVDCFNPYPTVYAMEDLLPDSGIFYRAAGCLLACDDVSFDTPSSGPTNPQGRSWGVTGVWGNPFSGHKQQLPNLWRVEHNEDSVANIKPDAGAAFPYLVLDGQIDWIFGRGPRNDIANGIGTRFLLRDGGGNGVEYDPNANGDYYEWRRLIPAQRLLWDWQLSQTIPSSSIFNAPRIGLTIKHQMGDDKIPTDAKQLLIFRTLNSLDPAFDPLVMGYVATVDVPEVGTDLYYFDETKDAAIDFGDSPQNYEGIQFGIGCRYIQLLQNRLHLAMLTEFYRPQAPRGEIGNPDETVPMNENVVFEAISAPASSNPFDHTLFDGSDYMIVYRDINGFTSDYKKCPLIDRRADVGDDYVIRGYFLGHGLSPTIKFLDVYRRDTSDGDPNPYVLVSSLTSVDGGVFHDDTKATTNPTVHMDLSQFGIIHTIPNYSSDRWTEPNRPDFIRGDSLQDVLKGDGEIITGLDTLHSNLYITKPNSLSRMLIDISSNAPGEVRLETISLSMGCISPCTLLSHGAMLMFLSNDGLIAYDGSRPHQLDVDVYNDIQSIRLDPNIDNFTGVFVPRYGAYWLSVNTKQNDFQTSTTSAWTGGLSTSFTFDPSDEGKFPTVGHFSFTIDDGFNQGTGYGIIDPNDPDNVLAHISPDVDYGAAATIKVFNTNANVWVFDLFYANGQLQTKQGVVTRFLFPNQKLFLRRRDGKIVSSIIRNPTALNDATGKKFVVLEEDGGASGMTWDDAGVDAHAEIQFSVVAEWVSKLITGSRDGDGDAVRIHRTRFTRIRAYHSNSLTGHILPLAFTEIAVNTGEIPANAVPDAVTRYHAAVTNGNQYDDNVKFVCLNEQRGLDIILKIRAENVYFVLREIESDYTVKRVLE